MDKISIVDIPDFLIANPNKKASSLLKTGLFVYLYDLLITHQGWLLQAHWLR
jgi:hypothetical protein